jgi:hypothetical protein
MSRQLVFTVDYELFGNGCGDVRQHITGPMERMCRMAEKFESPISIYFELEEYLAFERHAAELQRTLGYDPAEAMRRQAAELAARGHDIQLHLHPQWNRGRYDGSAWQLTDSCLTVDALFETQEETTAFIRERRCALEELSGKPVLAYRAGGFAAQPGKKLLLALEATGFAIESSVVRGLHLEKPVQIDYRRAPDRRRLWRISDAVDREDLAGRLWEIPIHSVMGRRYQQLSFNRLKAKFSRNVPKARQREIINQLGVNRDPVSMLSFLWRPVPIKLDYHNLSPATLFRMILEAPPPLEGDLDVLVLIGHTKEHINDEAFEHFLKLVAADSSLQVVSLTEIANQLRAPRLLGAAN